MGETTLNRAQYEQIFRDIARSWYTIDASALFFAGLHHVSKDKESARYYWMTCYQKDAATHQTAVSKVEYYQRAVNTVRHIQPKLLLPLYNTKPEDIVTPPLALEDFVPPKEGLPSGRITLLGDALHLMTPCKLSLHCLNKVSNC